jgi:hypothetical protein
MRVFRRSLGYAAPNPRTLPAPYDYLANNRQAQPAFAGLKLVKYRLSRRYKWLMISRR